MSKILGVRANLTCLPVICCGAGGAEYCCSGGAGAEYCCSGGAGAENCCVGGAGVYWWEGLDRVLAGEAGDSGAVTPERGDIEDTGECAAGDMGAPNGLGPDMLLLGCWHNTI